MKNILENLKDPRKKALTQLGFYCIFFSFVFILIGISNLNRNNVVTNDTEVEAVDNNYTYTFVLDDVQIEGRFISSRNEFKISGISPEGIMDSIDIEKYGYDRIESLIKKSDFIEKTTYKDNSEKTKYLVNDANYCVNCTMIVEFDKYIKRVTIGDNIELNYVK